MSEIETPKHKAIFNYCLCGASFPTNGLAAEHARNAEARLAAKASD